MVMFHGYVSLPERFLSHEYGYPLVSSNMAGWKIPELNGGFLARKITYFYGPWLPARLVTDDTKETIFYGFSGVSHHG